MGGIQNAIFDTIMKCDKSIQQDLFENIVITGGSTLFPGFAERLKNELTLLAPSMKINISSPKQRVNSRWIYGSILSSLSSFKNRWVLKDEYDEFGVSIV